MSGVVWEPRRPARPYAGRPRDKDRVRRERRPGHSDDFTRPINRRVTRYDNPKEEDE